MGPTDPNTIQGLKTDILLFTLPFSNARVFDAILYSKQSGYLLLLRSVADNVTMRRRD